MNLVFARLRSNNSQNDSPYNSTADTVCRISMKRQFHSIILHPPNAMRHRRLKAVWWVRLLGIRLESIVESDGALRSISVERQCEKDFRWHSLMDKPRHVFETNSLVVIRMPHETTSLSIDIF